jgi:hypothetical protein
LCVLCIEKQASKVVKWGSDIQESIGFNKNIKKSGLLKMGIEGLF